MFIFGIILAIVAFVGLGLTKITVVEHSNLFNQNVETYKIVWMLNKRQFLAMFALLFCLLGFIAKVPANSVGIVYSPFGGTKEQTLGEGINAKNPFDKIYNISTEVQTLSIANVTTQTKDAQYVNSALDIKYRVSPTNAYLVFKQYRKLETMTEALIAPTTQRVLELITTKYNVIDILGEGRGKVYSELEASLSEEFAKYGVEFYSISISDMDAGEAIEKAIEQEAIAKKAVETAEQNLLKAETEAKQKSVLAKAEQDAAKIKSETKIIEAEAEAKANQLLTASLTERLIEKALIDNWDGKMPVIVGDSSLMLPSDILG